VADGLAPVGRVGDVAPSAFLRRPADQRSGLPGLGARGVDAALQFGEAVRVVEVDAIRVEALRLEQVHWQRDARAGLSVSDIDMIELNEAFAAQAVAVSRHLEFDMDRLNVNGGAVALGHPLGCTGAKLTVQLMHEMERRDATIGLVTMCIGGGMGAAGIFERIS
jgi:hypothetical protein